MTGDMQDGIQDSFICDPFLSDNIHQLPAQALMPVCVFECSHKLSVMDEPWSAGCKIICFKKYLQDTFFSCKFPSATQATEFSRSPAAATQSFNYETIHPNSAFLHDVPGILYLGRLVCDHGYVYGGAPACLRSPDRRSI